VDSTDLYHWGNDRPVITDYPHEGPNAFHFKGFYWLITDRWDGLDVFRSTDCESWKKAGHILNGAGAKKDDSDSGRHADVLVQGDKAYIVYFTHPGGTSFDMNAAYFPFEQKRSAIFMAELVFDGNKLEVKGRSDALFADLIPGVHDEFFPGCIIK
jgi:hypothetical protein